MIKTYKTSFKSPYVTALIILNMCLAGCSVYQASSDDGISPFTVIQCKDRNELLSSGMQLISERTLPNGKFLETYRGIASKSGVNYLRALGYGVLDVATLGLWEVAGTPIEGAITTRGKRYIVATLLYSHKSRNIVEERKFYTPR